MRSSNDLFQLIKSLDKNEKRYFRLFSELQRGDKRYMLVFNAIEKRNMYDEKKLIRMFREEKFIRQFPVVKQYLYNLILSSLESYHTNVESMLYSSLHRIAILFDKGLHSQCEKLIAKAKQSAVKYDFQMLMLELLKWEVKIINKQSFIGADEDTIRQIYNTIFSGIEQYKTANDYSFAASLLFLKESKTGTIRSNSDIEELKKIAPQDLSKDKNCGWAVLNRFYMAYGIYFSLLNDNTNAHLYHQKQMQLFETNPHQITENTLQYAQVLHNFFLNNIFLKKHQECANIIDKTQKLQIKSPNLRKYVDFLTDEMKLLLCLETGEFNTGLQLIKSREGKMDPTVISKGQILLFQHHTAYLYFATGDYHKANEYLNKIINDTIDTRSETQCFARILSLLVHFELGNQDLLEYRVKSVYRFFYKRNRLYRFETIVLDFIRKKLPEINSQKELKVAFTELKNELGHLEKNPFEKKALDYFDFVSWLESKIEGRAFAEVVREKAIKT